MRVRVLLFVALIAIVGISASSTLSAPEAQLPPGWHQITPGGDAVCGRGAPYSFYARDGASTNLVINFQGGGFCWNGLTCNASTTTFDDSINPADPSDNPSLYPVGITHFENGENPFAEADMVYVNYCTGDAHTGNRTATYDYEGNVFEIQHRGVVNARAALEWTYQHFPNPESVFITGCSAGAIGAGYWASDILNHYPGARAALFGDSGGGWRSNMGGIFDQWGTNYRGVTGGNLSFERFYITTAQNFPNARVAQFNTSADDTQWFFHNIGFGQRIYPEALAMNMREIESRARNFRFYVAWGGQHCMIPRAEFYSTVTQGVRLRDWVASIAAGEPVDDIYCSDCLDMTLYAG